MITSNSTAVLIPTYGRAERLPALVANLSEITDPPISVFFVAEHTDHRTIRVLTQLDQRVLVSEQSLGPVHCVNTGSAQSADPFVFTAADDVPFRITFLR